MTCGGKWCFLVVALAVLPAAPAKGASPDTSIVFLGSFYTERFTEEHEYRDQFDLWHAGRHAFGLTSSVAGLMGDQIPMLGRFEGTWNAETGAIALSNWFRGVLEDSLLTGAYDGEPDYRMQLKRSADPMETQPSRAPLSGYEAWRAWADSVIDESEARSPYLRPELAKCEGGDGIACVGIGNRLRERKPEEARRYWARGCDLGAWAGCKFLGDQARYQAILLKLCSENEAPSIERNMACQELAATAEKAGRLEEAIAWYRLGCNDFALPTTNCARLKSLREQVAKGVGGHAK